MQLIITISTGPESQTQRLSFKFKVQVSRRESQERLRDSIFRWRLMARNQQGPDEPNHPSGGKLRARGRFQDQLQLCLRLSSTGVALVPGNNCAYG